MPDSVMSARAHGDAHAKIILIGEHAVVYGHPAIAMPVPSLRIEATARFLPLPHEVHTGDPLRNVEATPSGTHERGYASPTPPSALTLDVPSSSTGDRSRRRVPTVGEPSTGAIYVDVDADHGEDELAQSALRTILTHIGEAPGRAEVHVAGSIPTARGLGSSAAMASAIAVAVGRLYGYELSSEERFELVQHVERIAHGTPSGLDAYATMADGPLWFRAGQAEPMTCAVPPRILIADTGIPGRTLEAVQGLRRDRERNPHTVNSALEMIAQLAHITREALGSGDLGRVGASMNECQDILASLGLSHPRVDALVDASRSAGALGAKLTGGGQGGCMIALASDASHAEILDRALREAGAVHVWSVQGERAQSSDVKEGA